MQKGKLRRFQFNEIGWWTEDQLRKRDEKFFAEIEEYNRSLPELRRARDERSYYIPPEVIFLNLMTGLLGLATGAVVIWKLVL